MDRPLYLALAGSLYRLDLAASSQPITGSLIGRITKAAVVVAMGGHHGEA